MISTYSSVITKFVQLPNSGANLKCILVSLCSDGNINAEYVSLDADMLMDSIKAGKWHPGTDSSLAFFDKDKNTIISSI